jgi:GDSL-like lipase/acylhydrolase family protein
MRKVVSVAFAVIAAAGLTVAPALADGPGVGTATVVSVGDSAISGEAGRWAGNTNGSPSNVDALGSTAYYDNAANTAETIHGCHRSKASEIGIGGGVASANLACSGARTYTQAFSSGSDFKPGLDFYDDGAGHIGQAKALQQYAASHNVKMVVVLIGANDYGFADIVAQCVLDWLTSPSWWKNFCNDDSSMTSKFTASNVASITTRVKNAFLNLRTSMRNAGYSDTSWTLLAQTYSSPLPRGSGIRYSESGFTRQSVGGCGTWNADANWANETVVAKLNQTVGDARAATGMTNAALFDAQNALVGHRLCENTDGLLEEQGLASWRSAGAADRSEWVSQIRTTTTLFGPYQLQEDAHPSYWGQLALRNCVRQAYNAGAPRGGTCSRTTTGLNARGEPNMSFGQL